MAATIRPAHPGDLAEVLTALEWLFAAPGGVPPGWNTARAGETFAWVAASDHAEVLLAEDGGAVVGLCSVYVDIRSIRFGQRAWVEDLVVDPARRSGGVGKALLEAAKHWARERGATHLELDSGDARTEAHRFYEREQPGWTSRCFAWPLT